MSLKALKRKLWFNIFIRVAAIFLVFVLILSVCNSTLLVHFFVSREKTALVEQIKLFDKVDLDDTALVLDTLSEISEGNNFDAEIYRSSGTVLYTTHGGQMLDYFQQDSKKFNMVHDKMTVTKRKDLGNGIEFQVAKRNDGSEFLLCKKELESGIFAEVRIQQQLISNSAAIANEFLAMIADICLVISLGWTLLFARKFSRPVSEMNEITRDMANLDFKRKIKKTGDDEIGQLSVSINELSDSLSFALADLKAKNQQLENDIELERRLDVMRKAFIANVSHELKTPLAIINGYAEGLKLNLSTESKDEYCNTIIEEGKRMNRLVLSIMELSKYESGQIPVKEEPFDLSLLCGQMMTRIFTGSTLSAENRIPAQTMVLADMTNTEQVLKALLENAVSHAPEKAAVRVECEDTGTLFRVSVINSGSHIDEDIMPQIWQSFYRGDTSHKRDSSHFGLGLSIVATIMKMQKLQCGVKNLPDGVCFWFEIKKAG